MKFYTDDLFKKVREKRKSEKLSLRKLESFFGIPDTTISKWVKDIANEDPNFLRSQKLVNETKKRYLPTFNINNVSTKKARLICSIFYWCEGSKYPSSNCIAFCNSDERMVSTFLFLLRKAFKLDENKFRAHLQLHNTHDIKRVTSYWSQMLNIPIDRFWKPTITKPTNTMKRLNYNGTCTIKYFDVKLLQGLMGIYENFGYIRRDA
ncbi:MAG: hypothetical protein A3C71_02135 [Candidatus Yanofskybacteria bacterium RIFCSPHIGHO2_02_FULL_43_15c]|uniref:Uncharacterized protein n=2 Tax=Candidatus Yanofskyibacteriota TaxID=1752733 RepID=A0A1F8GZ18_9BACT|nr:MAG: hypothetical protein A3C71_02135 [Candidatus Yanofskybacteria bacterium RIFCSPHIGHO2_02_FULL_43_15c]OGN30672.1 MAG: hypothetical protein A3I92_01280 [Candidatus Yanofskybacteria bacterium RIFCSPLOWO2_02_FULL_43_10b]